MNSVDYNTGNAVQDKKKIVADEPVFGLASVDLVETEGPTLHIAQHLPAIRYSST